MRKVHVILTQKLCVSRSFYCRDIVPGIISPSCLCQNEFYTYTLIPMNPKLLKKCTVVVAFLDPLIIHSLNMFKLINFKLSFLKKKINKLSYSMFICHISVSDQFGTQMLKRTESSVDSSLYVFFIWYRLYPSNDGIMNILEITQLTSC